MSNDDSKFTAGQTKTKLWLDIFIFIAFLIAMEPHASGLAIHEWLTLSLLAVFTVHLLLSWDWITTISRRFLGRMGGQTRFNYLLNWLLFFDGTLLIVSGIMISEVAMPALGIQLPLGFAWRRLHDLSANFALVLLGVHTALHWSWIARTVDKYWIQPCLRIFSPKQNKDTSA